jgi:hypothetical protein
VQPALRRLLTQRAPSCLTHDALAVVDEAAAHVEQLIASGAPRAGSAARARWHP